MIPVSSFGRGRNRGFLKAIIGIILAIVILKYALHIDVLDFLHAGKLKPYFDKWYMELQGIWMAYIQPRVVVATKYILIAWAFVYKYALMARNKAAAFAAKFLHTVPS